jgi:hypothetical protein
LREKAAKRFVGVLITTVCKNLTAEWVTKHAVIKGLEGFG